MNALNATLDALKNTARAAGREAAALPTEHERTTHLVGAYGRNVRGAWDGAERFDWNAYTLTDRLNRLTTAAYESARPHTDQE